MKTFCRASLCVADQATAVASVRATAAGGHYATAATVDADAGCYFAADLVHEGRNGNGDVFTRAEMEANWHTLVSMPIDKDHIMLVDGVVGQLTDVAYGLRDGQAVIRVAGYISSLYPDVVWKILRGIVTGVSMECLFQQGLPARDGRVLKGVQFIGMGLTRLPADSRSHTDQLGLEPVAAASRRQQLLQLAAHTAREVFHG